MQKYFWKFLDIENEQIIKLVANSGETPHNSRDYTENGIHLVEGELPGPSTIGMEDASSFKAYNSFSEIPTYVPPLPTPLPSNMENPTFGLQVKRQKLCNWTPFEL